MRVSNLNKKFSNLLRLAVLLTIAAFSTAAYSAAKTVLVLGDSLSAEYGIARGTGWVALLDKRLKEKNLPYDVVNASISGETSIGGKNRLPALMEKFKPDIVIIELGGNDALRGLSLEASAANFRDMISTTKKYKAKPVLVGMQIPPNYGRDYTEKFFGMYASIAKDTRTTLVPFLLNGVADKPELFQPDRIHLIAQAHPAILENVWTPLAPLLK